MRPTIAASALVIAASLGFAPGSAAWAQSNPMADQIINSLKPTTRGIRPSPGPAASAPETPAPQAGEPRHDAAMAKPPHVVHQAASRPGSAAPANTAVSSDAAPSVNLSVEFRTGSADLTPQAVKSLTELGRALSSAQLASYRFRIEGHTDTVGTPEENKALSDRRARAVVDYLVTHFGVDRARLESVGMGEEGLMVQTPPQTPEARNRRVQVINLSA